MEGVLEAAVLLRMEGVLEADGLLLEEEEVFVAGS